MHAPHAVIVSRSHMCRSEAGAATRSVLLLHHVPAHSHAPISISFVPSPDLQSLPRKVFVRARRLSTLRCLPSPYISLALPLCNLACAHSLSFILSLCTGPRPSQPWCAALHACILPCLPSPSLSFPLPICSLFHLISLSCIFAYPLSRADNSNRCGIVMAAAVSVAPTAIAAVAVVAITEATTSVRTFPFLSH